MKKRKPDFLYRRPVRVTTLISINLSEPLVASRLPEEYLLDNGRFRFPAGYWESYFVNGKEYNVEGNRTVEEQRELIAKDLAGEDFSQDEIDEFITDIETEEGRPMLLTPEASNKWLKYHPEYEREAFQLLKEIINELRSEIKTEPGHGMKKR